MEQKIDSVKNYQTVGHYVQAHKKEFAKEFGVKENTSLWGDNGLVKIYEDRTKAAKVITDLKSKGYFFTTPTADRAIEGLKAKGYYFAPPLPQAPKPKFIEVPDPEPPAPPAAEVPPPAPKADEPFKCDDAKSEEYRKLYITNQQLDREFLILHGRTNELNPVTTKTTDFCKPVGDADIAEVTKYNANYVKSNAESRAERIKAENDKIKSPSLGNVINIAGAHTFLTTSAVPTAAPVALLISKVLSKFFK